jgi:O-antigen/teichoic acid export membrane protein
VPRAEPAAKTGGVNRWGYRRSPVNISLSSIRQSAGLVKRYLGPLAWGSLVVFLICRCCDIATMLCRFFLGHRLSTLDFGAIDPVLSVLGVLGIPTAVVFQIAVKSISRLQAMGKEAECRGLLRDLAKISTIGSIITIAVVLLLRDYILVRLHLDSAFYIYIIAALILVSWWNPMYMSVLQGGRNYRLLLVSGVLSSFLLLFITLAFVGTMDMGLRGALLARVGASAVTIVIVFAMLAGRFRGERAAYGEELAMMKRMVLPMTVYIVSTTALSSFDRLFVRNYLLADSGGYGAIVTLGSIPTYLIGAILFVIFPLAAAEHAKGNDIARFHRNALLTGLGITLCSAAGLLLFAGPFIPLIRLWNAAFVPYARYLWIYAIVMGFQGTIQTIASVEMARHRYGFLWFIALPASAMCGVLYLAGSGATIPWVLAVLIVTHSLILAGVWLFGVFGERRMTGCQ